MRNVWTKAFVIYFCMQLCIPAHVLADESGSGSGLGSGSGSELSSASSSVSSVSSGSSPKIVINELMWMGSDVSTADEWVEMTGSGWGSGSVRRDIGGWTLSIMKTNGEAVIATFPAGSTIGSGEYLVVSNYSKDESRLNIDPFLTSTSMSLPSTKLLVRLRDSSGALIDEVDDGVGVPFAGANPGGDGPKASMERIDMNAAGNIASNWHTAATTYGFDSGSTIFGTPGFANGSEDAPPLPGERKEERGSTGSSSSSSTSSESFPTPHPSPLPRGEGVRINELLPNPKGSDTAEWIELKNTGSGALSLSGMTLRVGTTAHVIHSNFIIATGGLLLLTKSDVSFSLTNAGNTVSLERDGRILDSITYPTLGEEVSYGRSAVDESQAFCVPTPGRENEVISLDPTIVVQSGDPVGITPVTLNVATSIGSGSLASATCHYDFGDGFTGDSCNPGSHSMRSIGPFTVRLTLTDQCSNTVIRTLDGNVSGKPFTVKAISAERTVPLTDSPSCTPSAFTGVLISEVLPNPSGDETDGEWIELQNPTDRVLPLCGWSLDDEAGGSKPYDLSATQIPAHGFLLFPRSKTQITLNNDHDLVRVIAPLPLGGTGVLTNLQFDNAPEDQSYALKEDGTYAWSDHLTPGAANQFDALKPAFLPSSITISGVLPNPSGLDTNGEWVELENTAGYPIWLNHWALQDSAGKRLKLDGIVLAKKQRKKLRLDGSGLRLKNTGGAVFLVDNDNVIRSVLSWQHVGADAVVRPAEILKSAEVMLQKVIDGDTIAITNGSGTTQTVRLLGVDALEIHDPDSEKLSFAIQSTEFIRSLLKAKKLELQFDTKTSDKYGRMLAYMFADGVDVQEELLTHGLAYAYRVFDIAKEDEYIAYEQIARDAHVGIWNSPSITKYLNDKEAEQQHFHDAFQQGLKVNFNLKSPLVEQGSSINIQPTIPSGIFLSTDGRNFHSFSGSFVINGDTTLYAYAEVGNRVILSSSKNDTIIRSSVVKKTYVVAKDAYPLSIFINEVFPLPKKGGDEWVELWNSSDTDVSLAGWQLDDVKDAGSKPWTADVNASIPAHGYLILPSSVTHLALNNGGDDVRLISPDGHTIDHITYPKMKTGTSYARDPNSQNFCITTKSTPGELNTCSTQKKSFKTGTKLKSTGKRMSVKKAKILPVSHSSLYSALLADVNAGTGSIVTSSSMSPIEQKFLIYSIAICAFVLGAFGWGDGV